MSSLRVKFVSMPGIVATGRWMTANWQRARSTRLGLSAVVAVGYFSDSLRINEQLLNLPAVALTYNNIANIHAENGDFDRAEYYHKRSLAIRRRIGDPFGISMSFGNIGSMRITRRPIRRRGVLSSGR